MCVCVCVCVSLSLSLSEWSTTVFKVLFVEMYVNVVFVIRCFYSAVSLILVREQRFIRIINYYC